MMHRGWAIGLGLTAASTAYGQTFSLVGYPEGSSGTNITSLSYDGQITAGEISAGYGSGFTWSAATGRDDLILRDPQARFGSLYGLSGDGRVAVGSGLGSNGNTSAFRWSGTGTFQELGSVSGFRRSTAYDANADGSVIVGQIERQFGGASQPFRWTAEGGMQSLGIIAGGFLNVATAVSADGNTVCGWSVGGVERAWIWTTNAGVRVLPDVAGTDGIAGAYGMNSTGNIVVGRCDLRGNGAMWRDGVGINLGVLEGYSSFIATGVDDLGTVAVGTSSGFRSIATIWSEARGTEPLADYLAANGVQIPLGMYLATCTSVSTDGLTFAGTATSIDGSGFSQGFVVTIPAPASGLILGFGLLAVRRRR